MSNVPYILHHTRSVAVPVGKGDSATDRGDYGVRCTPDKIDRATSDPGLLRNTWTLPGCAESSCRNRSTTIADEPRRRAD